MRQPTHRISRAETGLLVIDIQERLLPAIHEKERVLQNALRLVQGAGALKVPVFVTEQYRRGLGPTVPEIAAVTPGFAPVEKLAFSACAAEGLMDGLRAAKVRNVILCGIESHVCVCQTCLDLRAAGFQAVAAADAISSRTAANWEAGLERMRAADAVLVSTEMILFELLESAGAAEFKQVLALVK